MTTPEQTPAPLAIPYPPPTAALGDTHLAIKAVADAADTALSTNAIYTGYTSFVTNSTGDVAVNTDLKTITGAVLMFCYGTGHPSPYDPILSVNGNNLAGVLYVHAQYGRDYAPYVGTGHMCILAWGGR